MVKIGVIPEPLYIEETASGQHLSADFILHNNSEQVWVIQEIELSVLDSNSNLVLRRSINTNGIRPGIETLGDRKIEGRSQLCVFNPFHTMQVDLHDQQLSYVFHLASETGDTLKSQVVVSAEIYTTKTGLCLPMDGRLIVKDGHDFYSHHRRVDLSHPFLKEDMGLQTNSGRFAYDFCKVNNNGDLINGDGRSEKDWYGFGEPVRAPGDGFVVTVQNRMQDNILGQRDFDFELAAEDPDSIMGNYVLIDHLNGEYSLLAHLKEGSVTVQNGSEVQQGQPVGQLGFSGSTGPWVHLHYELRSGIELCTSRGLPTYFMNYARIHGTRRSSVNAGHIETGDIVENDT